jgi:hypothetical protein
MHVGIVGALRQACHVGYLGMLGAKLGFYGPVSAVAAQREPCARLFGYFVKL